MIVLESFGHELGFVVRFDHHFLGGPVDDELPVRLAGSMMQPVASRDGRRRQTDGTYRFAGVAPGVHEVLWLPPLLQRSERWVSFEAPLHVPVPNPTPTAIISRQLWPTAGAPAPTGITGVRGKLVGAGAPDRRVEINPTGGSVSGDFSRTDGSGEFLFLLPRPLAVDAAGRVALTVAVDGAAVTEVRVGPSSAASADFLIPSGRASRVLVFIA